MTAPRFSVVIPAYNAAATIESSIRSVLLQTVDDFEIVVVDDGSIDETAAAVGRITDRRVTLLRQENSGPSAARNLGIERTHGEFVCPLDADDLLLPGYLETMGSALARAERAGFAYTDAWVLDASSGRIGRASVMSTQRPPEIAPLDPRAFTNVLLDRNFVFCCSLIRRTVLEDVGGYAVEISRSEDYELWLRIVANGYSAVQVGGRLAVYRAGQTESNSSDPLKMIRAAMHVYERAASTYPLDDELRAQALAQRERYRRREERLLAASRGGWHGRVEGAVRRVARPFVRPWRWHRRMPAEVRQVLESTVSPNPPPGSPPAANTMDA
ncbi:MAG: glycosyltransferase family 2 protein [Gaiella sp.]|nr:glycosyltransferase family 2 protein [Gaiella sp.]